MTVQIFKKTFWSESMLLCKKNSSGPLCNIGLIWECICFPRVNSLFMCYHNPGTLCHVFITFHINLVNHKNWGTKERFLDVKDLGETKVAWNKILHMWLFSRPWRLQMGSWCLSQWYTWYINTVTLQGKLFDFSCGKWSYFCIPRVLCYTVSMVLFQKILRS